MPGSSKSFPGTQGLPEILRAEGTDGSGSERAWGGNRRFVFPMNRLFAFLFLALRERKRKYAKTG